MVSLLGGEGSPAFHLTPWSSRRSVDAGVEGSGVAAADHAGPLLPLVPQPWWAVPRPCGSLSTPPTSPAGQAGNTGNQWPKGALESGPASQGALPPALARRGDLSLSPHHPHSSTPSWGFQVDSWRSALAQGPAFRKTPPKTGGSRWGGKSRGCHARGRSSRLSSAGTRVSLSCSEPLFPCM